MTRKYNSPAKQILNRRVKEILLSCSINSNSKQKGNTTERKIERTGNIRKVKKELNRC